QRGGAEEAEGNRRDLASSRNSSFDCIKGAQTRLSGRWARGLVRMRSANNDRLSQTMPAKLLAGEGERRFKSL
ncbi:hypothetical protein, partial [Burkholderia sp. SIMBA_052]|uniref:hypothetical protein n=1 Tax=Burkholderia sp. SIMBA_052 TaxID=3085793 RepID=UPI00397B5170